MKLDIGCGKNKKGSDWTGIDSIAFDGVDIVADIRKTWPLEDNSVDEAHCSHVLEHLTNFNDKWERVNFFNELYRVLKPGAACALTFPHWASNRYYGDPTHKEPFSEMGFYYLDKNWRAVNCPHADGDVGPQGYKCDFECTWGFGLHPELSVRNAQFQQFAMQWFKESCTDIIANCKKRAP